jgi:hypothetical protein
MYCTLRKNIKTARQTPEIVSIKQDIIMNDKL